MKFSVKVSAVWRHFSWGELEVGGSLLSSGGSAQRGEKSMSWGIVGSGASSFGQRIRLPGREPPSRGNYQDFWIGVVVIAGPHGLRRPGSHVRRARILDRIPDLGGSAGSFFVLLAALKFIVVEATPYEYRSHFGSRYHIWSMRLARPFCWALDQSLGQRCRQAPTPHCGLSACRSRRDSTPPKMQHRWAVMDQPAFF